MRRFTVALALLAALAAAPASAVIGTIDDVPAATLLLPYFEVDLTDPNGVTTLFTINNASASAALAHVTVWSDQSVPVLDFDVYLTGFDVQSINLRDILVHGMLPVTASLGQDPKDTISPQGPASQDINYASCAGTLPYANPAVSAAFRAHLQAWLQGLQSPVTGNCAGYEHADGIARGYVTVDTVNACNLFFPADWALYSTTIAYRNLLWGDYFYVHPGQNFAQGDTLVHIEAAATSSTAPGAFVPGDHTFYGRYNAATAGDQREPLPTTVATRYLNGGPFDGGTDLIVWREANQAATSFNCALAGPPSWFPLNHTQILLFDEHEQVAETEPCPSGDPTCELVLLIPNEANRIDVELDLLTPFDFGWIYLNLQQGSVLPIYGDPYAQTWATTVMDAEGRFSVGFDAIQLDNANSAVTTLIGAPTD